MSAPPDAAAAADRLEAWDGWACALCDRSDVLALVAGFRAAAERAETAERERDRARDYVASLHGAKSFEQAADVDARAVAAERRLAELQQHCPICGHDWKRHDPDDGCCDAHSDEQFSVCQCGRDMAWMHRKTAVLSRAALAGSVVEPAQDEARSPKNGETRGEEQL